MTGLRTPLRASSLLVFAAACALSLPAGAQTQPANPYDAPPVTEAPPAAAPGATPTPAPDAPPVPSTEALVPTPAAPAAAAPATPAAAAPATPAAAVEANEPPDDELMAELDAELMADNAASEPRLNLYGFADLTFYKYFLHEDNGFRGVLYTESAFAVGNLNLYLSSNLGSGWSSMAEVRFSYLPNGAREIVNGEVERTETNVADYSNLGVDRRTGSVLIERVYLQYMPTSYLTLRAGQWLTPYGIWNVDHGSPTIIPVVRPFTISFALIPERQTGIQGELTHDLADDLRVAAILGVSNGKGPVDEYADLDSNKAVLARLQATWRTKGTLQVGTTAYYGRYTDLSQSTELNGAGARVVDHVQEQYDELAIGADVLYKLGGFHLQAEFISNQRRYTDDGRPMRNAVEYWPDFARFGTYGVVGYRFDWLGLMPFVMGEYFELPNIFEPARPPDDDAVIHLMSGLNARPTGNVTLKLQGQVAVSANDLPYGSAMKHPMWGIQSQAAWAF
jgi:hypothetical protein